MMRYYDMPYARLARLMGLNSTTCNGALAPEIIKFFHISLDSNVSLKHLFLKNRVLPLMPMFGGFGSDSNVEMVCINADLLYGLKYKTITWD